MTKVISYELFLLIKKNNIICIKSKILKKVNLN